MSIVRVGPCGAIGTVRDLSTHELKNEAWTDSLNVRFLDGRALQHYGHGQVYGTPPIVPYHVCPVYVAGVRYWLLAGASAIHCVTAGTYTDLSGAAYTGARNAWTSTLLSGVPIFNAGNTTNLPLSWDLNLANNFANLANWPAATYCKALRAYKNQLVALNVTKGSTSYPFMVKWSHPADPGAVPVSWDETDPVYDAGEVDIAEGGDPIVDGGQLGGTFAIYKEHSIWRMDYTGGTFVQQFTKVSDVAGAMNRNCWVDVGGAHVVLTADDVILFDGQSVASILDKQARRDLFQSINAEAASASFVFKNPFFNEVFVCYATAGTVPDRALVYNYRDKTVGYRELPNLNHAAAGPVETGLDDSWDSDSSPWDSDVSSWNQPGFTPSSSRVMMASNDTKLFLLDSSTTFDGTQPTSFLERRGLSLGKPENMKLIRGIRPRIKGTAGETVNIYVGGANDPYEDPTYGDAVAFTIGSGVACDMLLESRYPAIKFASGSAFQWNLDSYCIDFEYGGAW